MSIGRPHNIDWYEPAKSMEDLNRRLGQMAAKIDDNFEEVFTKAVALATDSVVDGVLTLQSLSPKATTTDALPNDATKFLDGTGHWTAPTGAGGNPNPLTQNATITAPVNSDFSWVNQGTATVVDHTTSFVLRDGAVGNVANLILRVKSAPTPPYTITVLVTTTLPYQKEWLAYGLAFRDSVGGGIHAFMCSVPDSAAGVGAGKRGNMTMRSSKWTNATTFSADYATSDYRVAELVQWFKIQDDNTNRILSWSPDGVEWFVFHTVGRTDFLTANQVGIVVCTQNAAVPNTAPIVHVASWTQT